MSETNGWCSVCFYKDMSRAAHQFPLQLHSVSKVLVNGADELISALSIKHGGGLRKPVIMM